MPLCLPLLCGGLSWQTPCVEPNPKDLSLNELRTELKEIDAELATLARDSFLAGVGAIGYRSKSRDTPDSPEWIRVDWDEEVPINEVILVPSLWRSSSKGTTSDGFPVEFRVLRG